MVTRYPAVSWIDSTPGRYFAKSTGGVWTISQYASASSGPASVAVAHPHVVTYAGYSKDAGATWGDMFLGLDPRTFVSVLHKPTLFISVSSSCHVTVSRDRQSTTTSYTCPLSSFSRYDLAYANMDVYLDEADVLHMIGLYGANPGIYYTRSSDYGDTWTTPIKVLVIGNGTPIRVFARSGKVVVGYYGPQVGVSYNYWYSGYFGMTWLYVRFRVRNLYTNVSLDGGTTWIGESSYAPGYTVPGYFYAIDYIGYNAPCFYEDNGDLCLVSAMDEGAVPDYYEGDPRPPLPYRAGSLALFRNTGWSSSWYQDGYAINRGENWNTGRPMLLRCVQPRDIVSDQVWCVGAADNSYGSPNSLKIYNNGSGWGEIDLASFPYAEFPWADLFDLAASVPYYPPSGGFGYLF
jgi:hypothetical protein